MLGSFSGGKVGILELDRGNIESENNLLNLLKFAVDFFLTKINKEWLDDYLQIFHLRLKKKFVFCLGKKPPKFVKTQLTNLTG